MSTEDETPVTDCVKNELRRIFPDDCVAKFYYKHALCELALSRRTITGTIQSCMDDKDFTGPIKK